MYNLLITAKESAWDFPPYHLFDARRYLKHTPDRLVAELGNPTDPTIVAKLCSLPTLFMYEKQFSAPGWVGRIINFYPESGGIDIFFELERSRPITWEMLIPFMSGLGIRERSELDHTHWAVKDSDLNAVIFKAYKPTESNQRLTEVLPMQKPRIFIGSSVEGLAIAEYVQLGLDHQAECTLWSQGVFGLSGGTLDSLLRAVKDYEFAVLILTPDDLVHKRDTTRNSPRDNVLFELGLFMGALGRERTYIVYCRDEKPDLPTDLAGVTAATYAKRSDGNLHAAVGAVCTQIKTAINAVKAIKTNP